MARIYTRYPKYLSLVKEILEQYDIPVTVRQIYYRVVSDPYNFLEHTDKSYNNLKNAIVKMRRLGDIDWRRIIDPTRRAIGGDYPDQGDPDAYIQNVLDTMEDCDTYYSMPMWATQKNYVEVWVEKEALVGVIDAIASPFKVTVFPCKAYGSFTTLKEAVIDRFSKYPDKEKFILYFGDWDPTGKDADRSLQKNLLEYGFGEVKIKLERIAIWDYQAKQRNLKSIPAKETDTRYKKFVEEHGEETWEIDAIPPDELQKMVKESIESYINPDAWDKREEKIADNKKYIKRKMVGVMKNIRGN